MAVLKYLAKDYLIEALQNQRTQNERMMVPLPHHIEFVEDYIHKGVSPDEGLHAKPWLEIVSQEDHHIAHFLSTSFADSAITSDLSLLVKNVTKVSLELDAFEETQSDDDDDDSMEDFLSLSQDISAAMERFIDSPSNISGHRSDLNEEQFSPPNLLHDRLLLDEGFNSYLLEDLESPLYLEGLLQLLPTVDTLITCLQPKTIQDPFLDDQGRPYSFGKADLLYDCNTGHSEIHGEYCIDLTISSHQHVVVVGLFSEVFEHEEMEQEAEVFLELPVEDRSPLQPLVQDNGPANIQSLISKSSSEVDSADMNMEATNDLKLLVEDFKKTSELQCEGIELSPDFSITLNGSPDILVPEDKDGDTEGVYGHVSSDSGISGFLLESPCIPPPSSPITLTPLLHLQLGKLHSTPISDEGNIQILSPASMKEELSKFWEYEKMFDSVLALTLPCPTGCCGIEDVKVGGVSEVREEFQLEPARFDSNDDLDLCWDPLEAFYVAMTTATKNLVTSQPDFSLQESRTSPDSHYYWEEEFVSEKLSGDEDSMLSPASPIVITEEEVAMATTLPSDIPDLDLNADLPQGYLINLPNSSRNDHSLPTSLQSDAWGIIQQASATARHSSRNNRIISTQVQVSPSQDTTVQLAEDLDMNADSLDSFIMLRSSSTKDYKSGRKRPGSFGDESIEKKQALDEENDMIELEIKEKITAPVFKDICLSGLYLSALCQIESLAQSFKTQLQERGIHVPVNSQWPRNSCLESLKFLFKQLRKAVEDSSSSTFAERLGSCQIAASLYVTCSVMDTLTHCSLRTALGSLSSLSDRYSELIEKRIRPLKDAMMELESSDSLPAHPKLTELVRLIGTWIKTKRRSSRDKIVVIVPREFSSLSGEILDYVQSIPGLTSSVFSFQCEEHPSELYKKAIRERFHHYDCLVVPTVAVSDHSNFHWEKVSLLVVYEELKEPLFGTFPDNSSHSDADHQSVLLDRLNLQDYFSLRTVLDLMTSNLTSSSDGRTYTVIASEVVTGNAQLLQLLETRYNVLVVERDYTVLPSSKFLCWADLILSPGTGVLVRPLSTLSTESGGRGLISTATLLSLQYETCWIIFYQENQEEYELGGDVPHQLSLLHAAMAPLKNDFQTHILTVFSVPQLAHLVRKLLEVTHTNSKEIWGDRSWLSEEFTEGERFLLTFPCLNSFSAQYMLQQSSLAKLLAADMEVLTEVLSSLPMKVLQMFYSMCHAGSAMVPSAHYSPYVPTSIDAASNSTAPISPTSSQLDQDCFIYKIETAQEELIADNSLHEPDSHRLSTLPCLIEQGSFSDAAYGMPGTSSGLDDSLEDLSATITTEVNFNSQMNSFFHEDIASWLHPVEGDSQFNLHRRQLQCGERNPILESNNMDEDNSSTWEQQTIARLNFPSSCDVNFQLPQHKTGSNQNTFSDLNLIGDSNIGQALDCSKFPLQTIPSYTETTGTNRNQVLHNPVRSTELYLLESFNKSVPLHDEITKTNNDQEFHDTATSSEFHLLESFHNQQKNGIKNQYKERACWNNELLEIPKCEQSTSIGRGKLFNPMSTTGSVTHLQARYKSTENVFVPSFGNLSNCDSSQPSVFSHNNSIKSALGPECSTVQQHLSAISSIPNHSLATQWSSIPWQPPLSAIPEAAKVPAHSSKNLLVPRSTKIIASSTVRKPSSFSMMNRKPMKALDLDLVDDRNVKTIKSNDRNDMSEQFIRSRSPLSESCGKHNSGLKEEVVSRYFIGSTVDGLGQESRRI